MKLSFRLPLLLCILIFSFLGWHSISGIGTTASAFEIEADKVLWNHLSYQVSDIFGKLTTDVQLKTVPVEAAADLLIKDPAGDALPPTGATLLTLTVYSDIKPLLGSNEILTTQSWFEPNNARALQRVRLRLGKDKWQKSYRFTKNGVLRLRSKPQDSSEENLSPDRWTKIRNHFYPYGDNSAECAQILEPASLLYVLSGMDMSLIREKPLDLCVFNKKQLHRVQLNMAGLKLIKVNYGQIAGENEVLKKDEVETVKISFKTNSLAGPDQEEETFSFLGLNGDFDIYIEKASRIPVQVSGKISAIGKVDLSLQKVNLTPGNS
jgi:hypothetical protein